jgi:hypothetical protein
MSSFLSGRPSWQVNLALVALAVCVFSVGCAKPTGPNQGNVSGTVKLDGKPIEQGSINFLPAEGVKGQVTGGEIKDGQYKLADKKAAALGMNRVEIRALRKSGKKVPKPMAPQGEMVDELVEAVAPRFNTDSKLTFEIKAGENTANFDVESK